MATLNELDANIFDGLALLTRQWPDALKQHSTLELAFSGGLDSTVLLHLLYQARSEIGFTLTALHVHHGLSSYADQWLKHSKSICESFQIPLRIERVTVITQKKGLEAAARKARYEVFCQSKAEAVVLAHHADDQAETCLLQILRGGGVHALSAMPVWRDLTKYVGLWRPLLSLTKKQLMQYAHTYQLKWIEDDSNDCLSYRRNWLRHKILPTIANYLPNYRQHLQHCASRMAESAKLLDEIAHNDLAQFVQDGHLQLDCLVKLSLPRQKQLLLRWVQSCQLGTPTEASVNNFLQQLYQASLDKMPAWRLPYGNVYRYKTQLWPVPFAILDCKPFFIHDITTQYFGQWGGQLRWRKAKFGLSTKVIQAGLILSLAPTGTKIKTHGGHKRLKALFQEAIIPPFLRRYWPVLLDKNQRCIAIPSVAIACDQLSEKGVWPEWVIDKSIAKNQ